MRGISLQKGIILYYGNAAGYITGETAVADPMFESPELKDFLDKQNTVSEVRWKAGVFERLSAGQKEMKEVGRLKDCRIWQLKPDTDIFMRFIGYEELRQQFGEPNPQDYQMVYDGEVETNDLEAVYELFNQNHPPGYTGHSLSMSDVVELYDENGSMFYYCDRSGFQAIDFAGPDQGLAMQLQSREEKGRHMPTIETRVGSMYPAAAAGGVRAYASATIDGCLAIWGIRVMEGKDGLFVSMPSRKSADGYQEICFPVTKEFRQQLHNSVLDAYQQALTQTQAQASQGQEQSQFRGQEAAMQMGSM